jgi:glycosyltransferase involved in cell wall biosynthesis
MRIGFDAKRAFLNVSGLGNYSRNILRALSVYYPGNEYFLYTPLANTSLFDKTGGKFIISEPSGIINRIFRRYWRSFSLTAQLKRDGLDIYHGLSHELPVNINKTGIKTVVTIHDLIFLRYPGLYKSVDRKIYYWKFKYACQIADSVIAISKQTANDIQEYFNIDESKIEVIYQGCNPVFRREINNKEKEGIRKKYGFPETFILYVGNIEKRKNLLTLVKAVNIGKIELPLVIIGKKTGYYKTIKNYIEQNNISRIYFQESVLNEDLPAVYQSAEVFVYPSVFEGFGIPILEALYSKTPVITSRGGCFPETGGPSSTYINPKDSEEMADAIRRITDDAERKKRMIEEGYRYAQNFNDDKVAKNITNVYLKLLKNE